MNTIEDIINKIKGFNSTNAIDLLISIIVMILFFMISNLISFVIIKLFNFKEKDRKKIKDIAFYKPISNIIKITGIYVAIMLLNVPSGLKDILIKIYKACLIYNIATGFTNIFHPKSKLFVRLEEKTKYSGDKQLNNFISKVIKVIIYMIAVYLILLDFGYNIGGLVTGLGISSVVIAFAAQDIAKNLFGGLAILTDKPFKIGDWIEVDDYSGTVVDITFRSTKLQAVDNTIITINNSTIVESYVKNWGNIDKRRYSVTLNLPLETPEEKVKKLLHKIEFVIKTKPDVIPESFEVHFESIELEGIKILIFLNTKIVNYTEFENFKDDINLELLKILESENIKLAYSGQNIYVNQLDEELNKNDEKEEKASK